MADASGTRRHRPGLIHWWARSIAAALVGSLAFAIGTGAGASLIGLLERSGVLAPSSHISKLTPFAVATVPTPRSGAEDQAVARIPVTVPPPEPAPAEPPVEVPQSVQAEPAVAAGAAPPGTAAEDAQAAADETAPMRPAARPEPEASPPRIPAWMLAAVPVPVPRDRPMVAIVIDDLAVNQARSRRAIALPGPLTMSFLPYGTNLDALVADARERGHEIMIHLPMEPQDAEADPGPNALMTTFDARRLKLNLDRNLTALDGYIGVNNHMGSKFSAWEPGMMAVMAELRRRGLIYLDSLTTADTLAPTLARDHNVPYLARDVFLDYDRRGETVVAQLRKLERIALARGYAIGIGHPYDATIDAVRRWLETAEQRGFAVVPVSAIARANVALRG